MKKSLFTVLAVTAVPLFADINSDLQQLGGSAAQGYLGPLVSTLGSDLNTGWFREAPKPELWGINISGRLVLTGTLFSDDAKVFSTTSQTQIDELTARLLAEKIVAQQGAAIPAAGKDAAVDAIISQLKGQSVTMEIAGPTVIGSDKETIKYRMKSPLSVTVGSGPAATTVAIDDQEVDLGVSGSDMAGVLPGVAVPFPQITLGTLAGTDMALRWAPSIGDFSFFGIGFNHNPGFWLDQAELPLGINTSISFAYSSLEFGDFLEFSAWNTSVMASRRFGWRFLHATPYASLGYEQSKLTVSYTTSFKGTNDEPLKVGFEDEGENALRFTSGLNLRLGVLDISADYTLAKYDAMSLVFGLGF